MIHILANEKGKHQKLSEHFFSQFTSSKLVIFYGHLKVGLFQRQRYLYFTMPCQTLLEESINFYFQNSKLCKSTNSTLLATNYLLAYLVIISTSCSFFSWMRENTNGKGRRKWGSPGVHVWASLNFCKYLMLPYTCL